MKKTLELLKEELKRKEYKPFAEKMITLEEKKEKIESGDTEKALELIKQKTEVEDQFMSFCSPYLKPISNVFIKEFTHEQALVQAYITLAEQFIPENPVLENHLIGQLFNDCAEELFPDDEKLIEFAKESVEKSEMANLGLGSSNVVYKRLVESIK